MSKFRSKAVVIAILVAGLFGCGGEADEAKKLGFASVEEMKEVQAKGWHTKQKYVEDNPALASAGNNSIGSSPAKAARQMVREDAYNGWKKYEFANGSFEVKYPAHKADKSRSSEPMCKAFTSGGEGCSFTSNQTGFIFLYGNQNKSREQLINDLISGMEDGKELKLVDKRSVVENGLELTEFKFTNLVSSISPMVIRLYADGSLFFRLSVSDREQSATKSKEDADKFCSSVRRLKDISNENKGQATSVGVKSGPPSGQNEWLLPNAAVCAKAIGITNDYREKIASQYSVSTSSVKFLRVEGAEKSCLVIIDTPMGPKKCGVAGVIWLTDGNYAISDVYKTQKGDYMSVASCLEVKGIKF